MDFGRTLVVLFWLLPLVLGSRYYGITSRGKRSIRLKVDLDEIFAYFNFYYVIYFLIGYTNTKFTSGRCLALLTPYVSSSGKIVCHDFIQKRTRIQMNVGGKGC